MMKMGWCKTWTLDWTGLWTGVWIVVELYQENNYKTAGLGPWANAILPVESSVHVTV